MMFMMQCRKIFMKNYPGQLITLITVFSITASMINSGYAQVIGSNSISREEITENLKSGNVLSYQEILDKIPRDKEDRIIEAELVSFDGLLIYHLEILKANGIVEVHLIDGKTGQDASHLREE
jgi:uncharacterized membrane protein YkoI